MNSMGSYLFRILFHLIVVLGIWQLIQPTIEQLIRRNSQKNDYRREVTQILLQAKEKKNAKNKNKRSTYIVKHLEDLMYLVQKNYEPKQSVFRFFTLTIFIFGAVYLVTSLTMNELPNHLTFDNPFMGGLRSMNEEQCPIIGGSHCSYP
ncbi:hypothetical protein JI735_33910 (plasmid) [Paenibacillus sonchi]|uniref:Uncharacterized protein n=1 Tax=Paenibacillus sonchi TaxID=373687 RepID=A0A974SGQ9_9BACL|nr:hypothetical protein [Paenibacillus sonchi]QQZ64646.1 hypothetical protein JI735_33910 [Paenibacillus sonchi]